MTTAIDVRIYWDGELEPFADIVVDHPEAIPKVGDEIWLQWWKQSEVDTGIADKRPYPTVQPLTVLYRRHHLWVREGDRDLDTDDQNRVDNRWTQSSSANIHAKLEIALFVARVNKTTTKETP